MNKNPLSLILGFISSLVTSVFGSLSWKSPNWLQYLRSKATSSPKLFWTSLIALLLLISAGIYGYIWYKNIPKPLYITASITAPSITANEETLTPNNLVIDFGIKNEGFSPRSVAPIDKIGKVVAQGITMSPQIPGVWVWNSDSQLLFTPSEDWPAGQEYNIQFAKDFFNAASIMESHEFSFSTQVFQATITDLKFYQDPVKAEISNVVATIQFNFPVDPESLEKNTSLVYQTLTDGKLSPDAQNLQFTYTYDAHKRVAYLHSDPVKILDKARYLLLTLNKEVSSLTHSAHLANEQSKNVLIPDASNFMKIVNASASIVRNDKDRPEQVMTVETSLGINESDFNQHVHVFLLPKNYPASSVEPEKANYQWQNPGEVTDSILALSSPVSKQIIPTEHNYSTLHSFKFASESPRYMYVKIDKGLKGLGDFVLTTNYTAVIPVPEMPKEISFLHKGSLLALSGEKKLSVLVRGVPAVRFDFARVLPSNVNQLVTQTHGDFNNPYFNNPSFNQQNISKIFSDIRQFDTSDLTKQQYTALDLWKYLASDNNPSGPQGLFLIQATGWDVNTHTALDVKASRLILITDMGLLVKDNKDGTHDLFVESITEGTPVQYANVTVLGKNGLPILSRITDAQGRVQFPNLKDFVDDKEPTVYLATLNNDVSFIPFNNANRQLNFSKFDIGGIYTNNQELQSLSAYLFSDRGIYRPGDTVHVGMIIKQAYVQSQAAGLPLQVTVTDPRGATVKDEKLLLNETGYMDLDIQTTPTSATGQYQVNLYLVKDNHPQNLLGSTTVKVSEFQPDRMRITSQLSPKPQDGWTSPVGLKAEVALWNLYGAPATDRRIAGKILLTPQEVKFDKYPNYVFADPLWDPKKPAKVFSENVTEVKTNDKGQAELNLNLDKFDKATYQLTFFAEGFEAEGGRSVTTQSKTLISPLPYFVGYKADGDLTFIKQNATRAVDYIAVNPQLNKEALNDLKIQLVSLHPVTTLVKKADGTYQYQSIIQSTVISTEPFVINDKATTYSLPTHQIGDYSVSVLDKDNTVLSQFKYTVVGASQQPLAKNAELAVTLNNTEYKAGDTIELQITAPYTGTGLITIERDKVYASQWFKSSTTNSMQTIQIPADFQGNGYINVAFIRDWESPELFISPLSYNVVPFEVNHDAQEIQIDLQTAKTARPGEALTIDYKTDKPGKIIVFAVDEGILQVARYETPDPLAFFFEKHALEVLTQQTVDQILPKFIQDREVSAAGGDDGEAALAGRLNPFKRKTDLPVVYWSGIMDADSTTRQIKYQVPDYFNGSLKIMAVAVSTDAVGAKDTSTAIRGDFIVSPNVPTFATLGDEFEISASIANNLKDSGDHAKITVELSLSPELSLLVPAKQELEIAEGHEQTVRYKVRVQSALGSAKLNFKASQGDKSGSMHATMSIRPAVPFSTTITSGMSTDATKALNLLQDLFPEYRTVDTSISTSPMIFVFGLQRYLENFPYGCTEQLVSKVMPLLAMNEQSWFNKDAALLQEKVNATVQMLSQRQMSNGGFSYWPGLGENIGNNFASVYAMHFLTQARIQSFAIPDDLFYKGVSFLKDLASQNATDADSARIQAYAIYVLTLNELVTTNYLANLEMYLQQDKTKAWQNDITAVYIAASYQMLKSYDEANRILNNYKPVPEQRLNTDFYSAASNQAQYLYILARHFPERLRQLGEKPLLELVQSLNNEEMNTLVSSYASLALAAYPENENPTASADLTITQIKLDNSTALLPADNAQYHKIPLGTQVKQITINNPQKQRYFYQLAQSGFNKNLPKETVQQGIEIFREYKDAQNNVINSTTLGSEIEVHIRIRALDNRFLSNIAIEDLLPGGFEVVSDSVKNNTMNYFDIREDRVVFFGSLDSNVKELIYKIKATNTGKYTVPPIYAEAMYDPATKGSGLASEIIVTNKV